MATVQSYTKTGVDNKMASRSNVTLTYSGTGTPELSAFPDAKTGDIIERSSDRAQWRVLGNTLASLGHIVTKVNGQTGEVNITAAGLNASPTGHKHTIADITDLTVSTGATADHVVKRITGGNITVPTTPNANTSAASKSYVDSQVSAKANTSHTHTIANITDLTVSTAATVNHVVKRTTSGNITVPTTPNASTSAASKSYVDTEVGKKANSSHTHGISDVSGLQEALNSAGSSVHTHVSADVTDSVYGNSTASANRLVKTGTDGYLQAPITPTASSHSASKSYVDTEVGKKANTSHTHTKSQITDLETISTSATANYVVKRITGGNITVPTTPNANTSAASKSYVDSQVSTMANASHTHTKSSITDLETISTGATGNHIVKRTTNGNITVPATPATTTSATSKHYVDAEVGKKANTSHTHTVGDIKNAGVSMIAGYLVQREADSPNIRVSEGPVEPYHATSKSYVDRGLGDKADQTYVDETFSNFTHSGNTLLPMVPGTNTPMWAASFRKVTDDAPPGETIAYSNNADGSSIGMEWNNGWVRVIPGQRYRIRIWLKADTPGSDIVIWAYGDDNSRAIEGGTIGSAPNYPVWVKRIPTEWTLYEGTFRIRDGVTAFRIGSVTWNHFSGENTEAVQYLSGFEIWPDFAPGEHEHTLSQISGVPDSATALNTGNTIATRNADGNIGVSTPTNLIHAANKSYVDVEVGKKANASHTHTISQITDLTVSTAATANHVVKRTTSGNITVPTTPNASTSAASKSYVDDRAPEIKVVTPAEYPETPAPGVLYFITY